jgi:hypothetical protein
MQKSLLLIVFLQFGQIIFGQSNSISKDSCLLLYIKGGDLNLQYETDSLNMAIDLFDRFEKCMFI